MVDVSTVSIAIASASVVVGVVYYALQLRHQSKARQDMVKTRHVDLLMRLYSTYVARSSKKNCGQYITSNLKTTMDTSKKYGSTVSVTPANRAIWTVSWFFNGMGLMQLSLLPLQA